RKAGVAAGSGIGPGLERSAPGRAALDPIGRSLSAAQHDPAAAEGKDARSPDAPARSACPQRARLHGLRRCPLDRPQLSRVLDVTIERVAAMSVLLIVTFRPEFQPPWVGQAHVTTVTLSRLSRREGATLVGQVVGNQAIGDDLVAEIVERTDGVPLFVEEMTKAVLEAGAREERARVVSGAPLPLPAVRPTLHASLMARLDRLGTAAKEIAQIGAVIGREFSYELLASVANRSDAEVQAGLDRLSEAGLVFRRGLPGEAEPLFKHALVRDAAYSSLLRGQRQ